MTASNVLRAMVTIGLANGIALGSAQAQQPAAGTGALEEVIVTANRREENIQQVPLAVAAISAETAAAHGITDMQSFANAVPGLRVDRATATALPFLRGVGSPVGQVSAEPSIAFYVDDVYTPAAGAALSNFSSIASLEVAKGPQGTLFGRNATGGVIQVSTKNPEPEPAMDIMGYANYDTLSGSVYATGGLSDTLSANIALYGGDQGSGWGDNLTTGNDAFETNEYYGGRAKLLWKPSDATSVLLAVDHDQTKSAQGFYRPVHGTVGAGFYPAPGGWYDLVDHTDPFWEVKQSGASLKITQDLNWSKLVSITAYRDTEQVQYWDQSGAPVPIAVVNISGPTKTFTQEFQFLSPDDSKVTWIAGLFYMSDKSGYDPLRISGGFAEAAGFPFVETHTEQKTKSYAGFAQVNWEVFDATHLTLGARYTVDERDISASFNFGDVFVGPVANSPRSDDWSKPTMRVSLDHQFSDDVMAYVAYNRGFKSGMFNAVVFPGSTLGDPVEPETLDSYTVGIKSEFLDNRLRVNAEAFYYDYKELQITQIVTGGTALRNAAAATIKGIDVDITATLFEGLTLTAAFEVLDGNYDEYEDGLLWIYSPNCIPFQSNCSLEPGPNLKGNETMNTPPLSVSLRADYALPTAMGDWNFSLAYNHGGDYYFDADNGQGQINQSMDRQPKLDLVDASVLWTAPSGRYDVRLWGKNITDEEYITFGFEEALLTQFAPAPPATYGVTLGMHF